MTLVQETRSLDGLPNSNWEEHVLTTTAGRRIGYLARGPRDGRAVVYLHGAPGSRREQLLIPSRTLQRLGIRLISLDRPGYGRTDPLHGDRVARAADVVAAADALGIRSFPAIAVSSGGSYALALAATAPQRVERVVLCAAQMPYDDERAIQTLRPNQRDLLPALRAGRSDQLVAGINAARERMLDDPVGALAEIATLTAREEEWLRLHHALFEEDVRTGLANGADGLIDDFVAWPHPFEVDIGSVQCPVRALHGSLDDGEPLSNLQRVLAVLPDAQLFVIDGLSHVGPLLYPDLLTSLTET
jgi:pimeloyl-ACP methyl ester carboxylesterase